MATLRDEAKNYEPAVTKNIADLPFFPVDIQLEDREGTDKENTKFKYKVIMYDGDEYRIPNVVIGQIKTILEQLPDTKYVKVTKQGKDLHTRYTTLPHQGQKKD